MVRIKKNEFDAFLSENRLSQFISSFFPLEGIDETGQYIWDYVDTKIEMPIYSPETCIQKGLSYDADVTIIVSQRFAGSHEETERVLKLSPVSLMTEDNLFIINGREEDIFEDYNRRNGVTFTETCTTISLKDNGTLKLRCNKNGIFVDFGMAEVPFALVLRYLGYSTREILQNLVGCKVVRCTEEELNNCIGQRLAEPITKNWVEEYVDEDSGEIISVDRNELFFGSNDALYEEYIDIILSLDKEDICVIEGDLTVYQDRLLETLSYDTLKSTEVIASSLYKAIFGNEPEDAEAVSERLREIIFPSISAFTRSEMNLVIGQSNSTVTNVGSGEFYRCQNLTKEDYLRLGLCMLRQEDSLHVLPKSRKRTDQVSVDRLFYLYVKKELTRLTQIWKREGTLEKLSAKELAGHEKVFSIIDALAYLQLPKTYVSRADAPIYEDDEIGYNFTGEKLVGYRGESTQLEHVTIKEGTKSICTGAFLRMCATGCPFPSGLEIGNVVFPEGLEEIGVNSFADVDFKSDFQFPDSLISIEDSAFYKSSLRSFAIPKKLKYFGRYNTPFYPLCGISVHPENRHFCTKDNALYDKKMKRLILCSFPRDSFYSFENLIIEKLNLPEGLVFIDPGINLYNVRHLHIPSTLQAGSSWYSGNWFEKISVEENNECYSVRNGCLCSKDGKTLYAYEASKTLLEIPFGVKYIRSFISSEITTIHIPKGMRHITSCMFRGCFSLSDVYLPEDEILIDRYAFDGCNCGDLTFHVSERYKHQCKFSWRNPSIVYY